MAQTRHARQDKNPSNLLSRLTDPAEQMIFPEVDQTHSLLQRIQDPPSDYLAHWQPIPQPSRSSRTLTRSLSGLEKERYPNHSPLLPSPRDSTSTSQRMNQKSPQHSVTTLPPLSPTENSLLKRLSAPLVQPLESVHLLGNQHQDLDNQSEWEKRRMRKRSRSSSPFRPVKARNIDDVDDSMTPQTPVQKTQMFQTRNEVPLAREPKSMKRICHGTNRKVLTGDPTTQVQMNPEEYSSLSGTTYQLLKNGSALPEPPQEDSLCQNGKTSPREKPSISTLSLVHSTMLHQSKKTLDAWDRLKLVLDKPNQRDELKRTANGPQPGMLPLKRHPSSSLIERMNFANTGNTLTVNSPPNSLRPTERSYTMMQQSEQRSEEDRTSYSRTGHNSNTCTQPLSCLTELNPNLAKVPDLAGHKQTSVGASTPQTDALTQHPHADIATPAQIVSNETTPNRTARLAKERVLRSLLPKYLRYNTWTPDVSTLTTADWSLRAPPLPSPPLSELHNAITTATISCNPSLFKIVTPINVDRFESLLATHPNQPFVKSVCNGLRIGFWPFADSQLEGYPITHDESQPPTKGTKESLFLQTQIQTEQDKGRFSHPFGRILLPGMYSMPIHAVLKPGSTDLRLVTDHSSGPFSLNSMIQHSDISGYPLDNLKHLGEILLDLHHKTKSTTPLIVFKSDVSEAYRLLPVHKKWQIKQVNTFDGLRYVDRCNAFGGRASGSLWISFNSLVTWIARYVKGIDDLLVYVDDSFKIVPASTMSYYEPFNKSIPKDQIALLNLWEEIGIPFKERKQISGTPLTVIGIEVDPNKLSFTLSEKARTDLLAHVEDFCALSHNSRGAKFTLRQWQRLAGWLNWSFNVFPLLRPCLNNFYPKISGKDRPNAEIWVNNVVRDDLQWASKHIKVSSGIYILRSLKWDESDADRVIYCDACMTGMGFWYPDEPVPEAFYSPVPSGVPTDFIFYYEALCVLSALHHVSASLQKPEKIIIFTDNTNTVDIFNSLRALPPYNPILKSAVDLLLQFDHQLRVLYVPGDENHVADAISRQDFNRALTHCPDLHISIFQPPQLPLGVAKK